MDIVVTIPKSEYANNLREREYDHKHPGETVGFRMYGFRPEVEPGDRIYFVRDGMVSYSKEIVAVEKSEATTCIVTGRTWTGKWKVSFVGERDERHLGIRCRGFQGLRYRWFNLSKESHAQAGEGAEG